MQPTLLAWIQDHIGCGRQEEQISYHTCPHGVHAELCNGKYAATMTAFADHPPVLSIVLFLHCVPCIRSLLRTMRLPQRASLGCLEGRLGACLGTWAPASGTGYLPWGEAASLLPSLPLRRRQFMVASRALAGRLHSDVAGVILHRLAAAVALEADRTLTVVDVPQHLSVGVVR